MKWDSPISLALLRPVSTGVMAALAWKGGTDVLPALCCLQAPRAARRALGLLPQPQARPQWEESE